MTPKRQIRDFPASVRQRLQNLAREQDLDFQRVLDRYTGERFLYRLSASDEVDRFVLKGAALFRIWFATEQRPTRDLDFLATGPENQAAIRAALEAICRVPCPEDGVAAHRDRGDFRRRATAFAGETPVACSRATAKTPHARSAGKSCSGGSGRAPTVRSGSWTRAGSCAASWDRSATA